MTITVTDTAPRVWVGCLFCYVTGRLVGDWFPATEAEEIDLAAVHKASGRRWSACEELWVFDHEFVPVRGEFGLLEAAQWGACFEDVGPQQWPALCAWVESGAHVTEGHGPIPSIPDFEERYCGRWDDFREYAVASLKRRLAAAMSRLGCPTLSHLQDRVLRRLAGEGLGDFRAPPRQLGRGDTDIARLVHHVIDLTAKGIKGCDRSAPGAGQE